MIVRTTAGTDVGRCREQNEDVYLVDENLRLFVVCDGMGGHAAGDVAARLAADTVRRSIRKEEPTLDAIAAGSGDPRRLVRIVRTAAEEACRHVHRAAETKSGHAGMGCTLTLLLVAGAKAAMAHIGDSRLYLCRDGAVEQLSTDHTMAYELWRRGVMTADEAKESRFSSALTRSVGYQAEVQSETLLLDVFPGDTYLLCSDGLTEHVDSLSELASHLSAEELEGVPDTLIELANERGGRDNITAVMVRAEAEGAEEERAAALAGDVIVQLRVLRAIPLFEGVRFPNLLRLLNLASVRAVQPGEVVVARGEPSDSLYVVFSGRLQLEAPETSHVVLDPGDVCGATTLLAARDAQATLRAVERGRLLVLPGRRFLELARRRPFLGVLLLTRLGQRLGGELSQLRSRSGGAGTARL